ncbi:ribosome small subunit-dependent GTPase A, partial [Streptococcus suis]
KEADALTHSIPEIEESSQDCKFRTCTHNHEPDCAVKEAVASSDISQSSFDNYLQFLSEIQNQRENYTTVSKKFK